MSNVTFSFNQLIPSPKFATQNAQLIADLREQGFCLVGVEVTQPEFARLLDVNFDPQHSGERANVSAAQLVFEQAGSVKKEKIAFFTTRIDLDALAGMAIFAAQETGSADSILVERVAEVNISDVAASTDWKAMPLTEDLEIVASDAAIINAFLMDRDVSLEEKVRVTGEWLKGASLSELLDAKYQAQVIKLREDNRRALADGSIKIRLENGVAVGTSALLGGTGIAYKLSPVIVLFNPCDPRTKVAKWTIAQFSAGYIDMPAVFTALNEADQCEGTWGGSATIGGSPQGEVSSLTEEKIVGIVLANLTPKFFETVAANDNDVAANQAHIA